MATRFRRLDLVSVELRPRRLLRLRPRRGRQTEAEAAHGETGTQIQSQDCTYEFVIFVRPSPREKTETVLLNHTQDRAAGEDSGRGAQEEGQGAGLFRARETSQVSEAEEEVFARGQSLT